MNRRGIKGEARLTPVRGYDPGIRIGGEESREVTDDAPTSDLVPSIQKQDALRLLFSIDFLLEQLIRGVDAILHFQRLCSTRCIKYLSAEHKEIVLTRTRFKHLLTVLVTYIGYF
jgi:hypothetical protein